MVFRNQNLYSTAFEDTGGMGDEEQVTPAGITSLPFSQPIVQPIQPEAPYGRAAINQQQQAALNPVAPTVDPAGPASGIEPIAKAVEPIAQPVAAAVQPTQEILTPNAVDNEPAGVFGLPSLAQQQAAAQQAQPAQPVQPVQPTGPSPEIINSLSQQILGQGLTSKWSGEGFGSAEANAADMAKILAGIGITNINQFGKITKTIPGYSYETEQGTVDVPEQTVTTYGNKLTGQEVPNTYSERQTGNFFGGTFSGKGNTGYGVQFDSQGNPIFYTQGASSNDLANIMKDLGPLGQIAIAAATGGMSLPAQLATNAGIQLLAGGNLGDIAKGTALSYLGGQAGNLISGSSGITDLLGKTGSDIAAKTAQQFVGSGGKADLGQALLGSAINTGVNSAIGEVPGLDNLSATDKNITSNLIAAVATGTPIDQAIQNALVNKASSEASSAVANARNAEPTPAPQTYEEMMAGIEPKMSGTKTPDVGPSNDDILRQIGAEDLINEPATVAQEPANLDQFLRQLQTYAEPAEEAKTQFQEKPQINEEVVPKQLPIDVDTLFGQIPNQEQTNPAADNLINKAVADTLGTKTENAAVPADGKEKTMGDIDWSQIGGDYGGSIADEIANLGNGNASSIFSGDGGLDLSSLASNVGDEDQSAPPANLAELLKTITTGEEGGSELLTPGGVNESFLSNLSPDERARYQAMQEEGYKAPEYGVQDLGISQEMIDEFNKNFNPAGGFGSQWQTVGTNRVMVNDDGTATILNPTTKETSYLNEDQVKALIKNGTLNSSGSGYVGATGGKGTTPGGSKATTSTKTAAKPAAAGSNNNTGMLMALMAMLAMMNNKGSGSSSAASSIPALSANRSQLPYAPVGRPGAGGVNYFSPTTYTAKAAEGGLMGLAGGGMSNLGGYSDGGRLLKGPGDGVSDSIPATIGGKQPARLATGEFVVPARIVSELGNGSTDAGAKRLYDMMDRVQKKRRKTKNVAADTKAHKYLPS
jgi:hypothetical protein